MNKNNYCTPEIILVGELLEVSLCETSMDGTIEDVYVEKYEW